MATDYVATGYTWLLGYLTTGYVATWPLDNLPLATLTNSNPDPNPDPNSEPNPELVRLIE